MMNLSAIIMLLLILISYSKEVVLKGIEPIREKIPFVEDCIKESKADKVMVYKLLRDMEFADDENFKCFLKCMYKSTEIILEDGTFDIKELTKILDHEENSEAVKSCVKLKGMDLCDTAYLVARCMKGL